MTLRNVLSNLLSPEHTFPYLQCGGTVTQPIVLSHSCVLLLILMHM